jgi:hypothetical protein
MFGCYRRGDANNPEGYVASIAAVLSLYEPDIVRDVSDPRTGISTSGKFASFMPNSGELKIYCDEIRNRRARVSHLGSLKKSPPPLRIVDGRPGRRANLFVPTEAPQYGAAYDWAQAADPADWRGDPAGRGIWVNWLDSPLAHLKTSQQERN